MDWKKHLKYKKPGYSGSDKKLIRIFENYFKTGNIPSYYRRSFLSEVDVDYTTWKYNIPGTNVYITEHIPRIKDIKLDLSIKRLENFERMAKINNWDDMEMGIFYYHFISDKTYKKDLDKTSYKNLKKQLLEIIKKV